MKEIELQYKLDKIKTEQFAINEDISVENKNFKIDITTKTGISFDDKILSISVLIKFYKDSIDKVFITNEINMLFVLSDKTWNHFMNNDLFIIPKGIAAHFLSILINTARGSLFEKLKNSKFSHIYLPLVNMKKLIKEDWKFELDRL